MLRWRKRLYPTLPRDFNDFGETLVRIHDDDMLDYYRGRLRCNVIEDSTGYKHIVFCDLNHIRNRFSNVTTLLIDATFSTRPNIPGCSQVLTVMAVKYNHVSKIFFIFNQICIFKLFLFFVGNTSILCTDVK